MLGMHSLIYRVKRRIFSKKQKSLPQILLLAICVVKLDGFAFCLPKYLKFLKQKANCIIKLKTGEIGFNSTM